MPSTTTSDLLLPHVSESKRATVAGTPPPEYDEEGTQRHILPVGPAESEPDSAPAFEQMVDARLAHLEAHLTRIEAVLLDLYEQFRTSNQTPDGRRSLQHICRRARLARQRTIAGFRVIALWVSKQCLRLAISCYRASGALFRFSGDTLMADRTANIVKELRERLRTSYPPAFS
ncbi:hypothetical protein DL546_003788 [Coniochaeta pulveracea]|uniref:Uncharacterized protein n=1 Tax=Coniochaeta pulveracea TaxID=177199 RepID=A0A420Y1M4_9PEZI|nr:hypothetical protein DL546_003788 [Coniochaeta pulveracea]